MLVSLVVDTRGPRPRVVAVSKLNWLQRLMVAWKRTREPNSVQPFDDVTAVHDVILRAVPSPLVIEAEGPTARQLALLAFGLHLPTAETLLCALRPEPPYPSELAKPAREVPDAGH